MKRWLFFPLLLLVVFSAWAQNQPLSTEEQLSFVGMRLADLIERFGAPGTVLSSRGNEVWQDDVVFRYAQGDFYIYGDRVWQVKFASFFGVSNGDRKAAVLRRLGNTAEDRGDHLLMPITGKDWPLVLRVNFTGTGQTNAIYLYRSDF